MVYTVQSGDSLWRIAWRQLGHPDRWVDLARLNHLQRPDRLLMGQRLFLPVEAAPSGTPLTRLAHPHQPAATGGGYEKKTPLIPARALAFVIADEFNPLRRKLVRKVAFPKGDLSAAELERILHPDVHGFSPRNPASKVPAGRHVLGMTDSRFTSASELPLGSPRFQGDRYWIDAAKAEQAGVTIHEGSAIAADLDRIAAKTKDPKFKAYIEDIRQKALVTDREVLLEGHIPAGAVKGAGAMAVTRGLQVVEGVGIVMTVYDLGKAGKESYQQKSVVPLAKESVRQAGGWAGAWAGAELGGAVGTACGIETGPGAIVTGLIGGLIGGVGGFMGADWAAKKIGGK